MIPDTFSLSAFHVCISSWFSQACKRFRWRAAHLWTTENPPWQSLSFGQSRGSSAILSSGSKINSRPCQKYSELKGQNSFNKFVIRNFWWFYRWLNTLQKDTIFLKKVTVHIYGKINFGYNLSGSRIYIFGFTCFLHLFYMFALSVLLELRLCSQVTTFEMMWPSFSP